MGDSLLRVLSTGDLLIQYIFEICICAYIYIYMCVCVLHIGLAHQCWTLKDLSTLSRSKREGVGPQRVELPMHYFDISCVQWILVQLFVHKHAQIIGSFGMCSLLQL